MKRIMMVFLPLILVLDVGSAWSQTKEAAKEKAAPSAAEEKAPTNGSRVVV